MRKTLNTIGRLGFIFGLFILFLLSKGCGNQSVKEEKPPNLLFIMTDQQRFDALSFAGNEILETPNLDRLAEEGAWFKNAYTPCAVCVPARASILTGHNVASTGVISNSEAFINEASGVMPMKTYDEILHENGYNCEYYGKWHTPTYRARIYNNPVTVAGKSTSELGPGKKKAYLAYLDPLLPKRDLLPGEFLDTYSERPYLAHPIDKRYDLASRGEDISGRVGQSDIHGVISIPTEYHISAFDGNKTIEALERLKDSTFSITCSFHHPHPPYLGAKSYVDLFPPDSMAIPESINDDMGNSPYQYRKRRTSDMYSDPEKIKYFVSEYYAMVKEVDDWVGEILDKLDELGLSENTLVIFTSDHGEMLGSHGMRGKFNFYEESAHIPMMIRFPGRVEPGTVVDEYVSSVNIFASILDYMEIPEHQSDGYSMRGLIDGTDSKNGKYVVTEWLSELTKAPSHMVLKDGWKLMLADSSAQNVMKALYDLNTDPYEMNNLLGDNPEASAYVDKVEELEACFREWITKTDLSNR